MHVQVKPLTFKLWSAWFYFTSRHTCYNEQERSYILTKQAICRRDRAVLTATVTPLRKRWKKKMPSLRASGLGAILGRTHTWPSCSVPRRSTIVSPPRSPRWPVLTLLRPQTGLSTVTSSTYVISSWYDTCMTLLVYKKRSRNTLENNTENVTVTLLSLLFILSNFSHRLNSHIHKGKVASIIHHVHMMYPCLCLCVSDCNTPKHTSANHARAKKACHVWAWYGALTLVKQTGLWGSNMLGYGTDCLVWVLPKRQ